MTVSKETLLKNKHDLKKGDKIITVGFNGGYREGCIGEIIEVDNRDKDIPYRVMFENGETSWVIVTNLEHYPESVNVMVNQTVLEELLLVLEQSLKNGFTIKNAHVEFESGLVLSVGDKG